MEMIEIYLKNYLETSPGALNEVVKASLDGKTPKIWKLF